MDDKNETGKLMVEKNSFHYRLFSPANNIRIVSSAFTDILHQ